MNYCKSFAIAPFLRELPLFNDMQAAELERLAEGSVMRRASRGEVLFRVGDPCEELHAVVSGQIKLFALAPNGQEKVIDLIGPGKTFAEALMFNNRPYIVNAQALSDTAIVSIKRQAILLEIEHDHRFALRMLAGISRKLHGLIHDVESYSLRSGMQRVIGYLLHEDAPASVGNLNEGCAKRIVNLPVSKATLASRLSLTPEYFSRVLHELITEGLIAVDKRRIHIEDPQRLSQYQLTCA